MNFFNSFLHKKEARKKRSNVSFPIIGSEQMSLFCSWQILQAPLRICDHNCKCLTLCIIFLGWKVTLFIFIEYLLLFFLLCNFLWLLTSYNKWGGDLSLSSILRNNYTILLSYKARLLCHLFLSMVNGSTMQKKKKHFDIVQWWIKTGLE